MSEVKIPPVITGGRIEVRCATCGQTFTTARNSHSARTKECDDCFWTRMGDDY